jgi:hypothetical protein
LARAMRLYDTAADGEPDLPRCGDN